MTTTLSLAAVLLLHRCAPSVATSTMGAVVLQESSWRSWAIRDDSAEPNRSYYPATYKDAVILARRLLAQKHEIDVGYAGIHSTNFASYNVDVAQAIEPCTNLWIGADILNTYYFGPWSEYAPGDELQSQACRQTITKGRNGRLFCRRGGALDLYGSSETALNQALQRYNSGRYDHSPIYAQEVISRALALSIAMPPRPEATLPPGSVAPQFFHTPVAQPTPTPRPIPTPTPLYLTNFLPRSTPR